MKYILILSFIALVFSGCVSSHDRFIRNMYAASEHYNNTKRPRSQYAFVADGKLTTVTLDKNKNEIHHHKYYDRGFKRYCEYYIIFSPNKQEILGWGFENNATAKYCEIRN